MNRITQLDPATATGKTKQLFDGVHAKLGLVPNLFRVFGNSPAALAVAEINDCTYCHSAHTYTGGKVGLSERVALAYTEDSEWRNRSEFVNGRAAITELLQRKWARELDYRLRKELWAFTGSRIAVRFEYEFHDDAGQWYRAYGNENWEFAANGLMQRRFASINDLPITEADRKFRWEQTS